MNLVEKAQKVSLFRLQIHNACKSKRMAAPTDEKISEYINQGYPMEVKAFMSDYICKCGVFVDKFKEFEKEVSKIEFRNKPNTEEMRGWFEKNGYDVKKYVIEKVLADMKPFYRETFELLFSKIDKREIAYLWNGFVKESNHYGEDSCLFDLSYSNDVYRVKAILGGEYWYDLTNRLGSDINKSFVQIIYGEPYPNAVKVYKDGIKHFILGFWEEMVDRIVNNLDIYYQTNYNIIEKVFVPTICKHIGVTMELR